MRLITLVLIVPLFFIMFASQEMYLMNEQLNKTFDIYNYTNNVLVWNYTPSKLGDDLVNLTTQQLSGQKRITAMIDKFVDFLGFTFFELASWSVEFGYTHPEYDFDWFAKIFFYILWAIIIVAIIPIIIPTMALVYVCYVGIKKLFRRFKQNEKGK